MKILALAVPVLVACCPQDEGKPKGQAQAQVQSQAPVEAPDAKWKVIFKVSLVEKQGKWVFVIDGTTTFPPEVKLRARIYALDTFERLQGGRAGGRRAPGLGGRRAPAQLPGLQRAGAGSFHEDVYAFVAETLLDPLPRESPLRRQATRPTRCASRSGMTISSGMPTSAWAPRPTTRRSSRSGSRRSPDDLVTAEKLYGELSDAYPRFQKNFNAAAWKAWKDPWYARMDALNKKNEQRYSLWIVWMERQAKMRVGGMCELDAADRWSGRGAVHRRGPRTEERVEEMIKGFHDYFEEAIEVIGINAPLDIRTVGPIVAAYEKAMAPLRAWILKPEGDGAAVVRRPPAGTASAALQQLVPLLQNRKRGYLYVNEVSVPIYAGFSSSSTRTPAPEALKKGLEEHDAGARRVQEVRRAEVGPPARPQLTVALSRTRSSNLRTS